MFTNDVRVLGDAENRGNRTKTVGDAIICVPISLQCTKLSRTQYNFYSK